MGAQPILRITVSIMPTFRRDVSAIARYQPGRPVEEVAREYGLDPLDFVKLASNESPLPPVRAAIAAMAGEVSVANRYPDNDCYELRHALAPRLGVDPESLWFGGGSSELLRVVALAVGGHGTNAVYPWPSFLVYRLATIVSGAEAREVPLDSSHRHDLQAMLAAIDDDTTVVYVCNPNNPTGTHVSHAELDGFIDQVPERVMIVVDEAYFEYVTADDYETAIPIALERSNVLVTRTFSKIHGLAALRIGYGIGQPGTIAEFRKAQAPFTVTSVGQVGAIASIGADDEIAQRLAVNASQRSRLESIFAERGLEYCPSQANFAYLRLGSSTAATTEAFLRHGVIIRPFEGGWVRVTIGTSEENDRFLAALDLELEALPQG